MSLPNLSRPLLAVAIGVVLIILGIEISLMPVADASVELRRAIAHGVGFFGMTMLLSVAMVAPGSNRQQMVAAFVGFPLVFMSLLAASKQGLVNPAFAAFSLNLTACAVGLFALLKLLEFGLGWSVPQSKSIVLAGGMCVVMSLGWEAYIQPFVMVYDQPPQGIIQGLQVVADLSGIVMGMYVSAKVLGLQVFGGRGLQVLR